MVSEWFFPHPQLFLTDSETYGDYPQYFLIRSFSEGILKFITRSSFLLINKFSQTFIKKYIKMKGREQHLPDLHLWTSLEQKESCENWRNIRSSQPTQLIKVTVLSESFWYFFNFCRTLSAPEMSTDLSQVGVALFPSF